MSNRSGHATMPSLSSSISSGTSTSTSSIKPPTKIEKPSKQVSFLAKPIIIREAIYDLSPSSTHLYSAPTSFFDQDLPFLAVLDSNEDVSSSAWWNLAVDLADDGPIKQDGGRWYNRKKLFSRPSWFRLASLPVTPSSRSKKKNNHATASSSSCGRRLIQISKVFKEIITDRIM